MSTFARALALSMLALVLAACSSVPKKAPSPLAVGNKHVTRQPSVASPALATLAGCAAGSPYAAAAEDPSKRGNYTAGGLYAPGVRDSVPTEVPDVSCIPEPLVTNEPRSAFGNRSPYSVLGKQYSVLDDVSSYIEQGTASYYGNKFHGRLTSNREVYDMYAFTAAHKTLPLPSFARVTNLDNGQSVVVRVNDRGPFHDDRVIDLSYAAAVKLGIDRRGTGRVEVRGLAPGETADETARVTPKAPARAPASQIDRLVAGLPDNAKPSAPAPASTAVADERWRYRVAAQAGKPASADAFDAWMRERGVRVATGRPAPTGSATTPAIAPTVAAHAALAPVAAVAAPVPAARALATAADGLVGDLMLQVASFASRDNANRALTQLSAAGIVGATLSDIQANGRTLWRLRVRSPGHDFAELAGRIARLGFGQPQLVKD